MAISKGWLGFLFVLFLSFIGLVVGTFIGGVFFVPEGVGLAGPAMALGYGLLGVLIALVLGIVAARKLPRERLRVALLGVGIVSLLIVAFLTYRFMTLRASGQFDSGQSAEVAVPTPTLTLVTTSAMPSPNEAARANALRSEGPLGVGMAKPHLNGGQPLYFYTSPAFDQTPAMMTPIDSVTFGDGPHHIDIKTAPPWFVPEAMKLDYDLLYLRAKTLTKNWLEVVVNRQTGQTAWVDRHAVAFIDWSTFLLDVVAVEVRDAAANPIRIKPLDHASIMAEAPGIPLPPLALQGSWMQVSTADVADRMPPTGWIRWRDGDRLLIAFSLLS